MAQDIASAISEVTYPIMLKPGRKDGRKQRHATPPANPHHFQRESSVFAQYIDAFFPLRRFQYLIDECLLWNQRFAATTQHFQIVVRIDYRNASWSNKECVGN